jgi:hypothetical protein
VRRTGGVLVPGFSKRFDLVARRGTTYLAGIAIGQFAMRVLPDGRVELDYARWPIVDVLDRHRDDPPAGTTTPALLRLPARSRVSRLTSPFIFCSSSSLLVPTFSASHERANPSRGGGAKPRVSTAV